MQHNTHNYVYLNSRDVEIKRLMYDQRCVDNHNLRRAIASLFVCNNKTHSSSTMMSYLSGQVPERSGRKKKKLDGTKQKSDGAATGGKEARTVDTVQD